MAKEKKINNHIMAQEFCRNESISTDMIYVVSFDAFFCYKDGIYEEVEHREMKKKVHSFLISMYPEQNITDQLVKDVLTQIGYLLYRQVEEIKSDCIGLQDCILDLNTFETKPFSRDIVAIHRINTDLASLSTPTPMWDKFLSEVLVTKSGRPDKQLHDLLQEAFGFFIINEIKPEATFFLVGQGSNGKSVILDVLESIIGHRFISAMTIQELTTNRFAPAGLIGKKLNICREEESKYLDAGKFKTIVSGEAVESQRKFQDNIVFKPQAKFIFASNSMPTFESINNGLRRRIFIIPFHRIFEDHEQDKDLKDKLFPEIGGIVAWALEGAKRLRKNNYQFTESRESTFAKEEYVETLSSALKFFYEFYEVSVEKITFVPQNIMYAKYSLWSRDNGRKALNSVNFFKDLRHNIKGILEGSSRIDGVVQRGFWINQKTLIADDDEIEIVTINDIPFQDN